MIYPTQRAVLAMAIGIPITLATSVIAPELWAIGAAWIAMIGALILVDSLIGVSKAKVQVEAKHPAVMYIGHDDTAEFELIVDGKAPKFIELKPALSPLIVCSPTQRKIRYSDQHNDYKGFFKLSAIRRGQGELTSIWVRWVGPLGLIWKQKTHVIKAEIPVISNIKAVTQTALQFFSRDASFGQKIQIDRGQGSEFDSLRDFVAGMDKRSIDWKHSARHGKLQAKEFRTERNHNIVFALDTGRLMCEPLAGIPRLDRALNAALLMSFVGLKIGDKVGFFAFDSKPRLFAKPVAGIGAFTSLQKQTAAIDYSIEETNFTLGLLQLSRTLDRRSLIIIFTDFVDSTNAQLMLENVGRLIKTHLVLLVAFKDAVLEDYMDKAPQTPEDVSRAVIAASLTRERDIVIAKLRRMGVQIVDAELDQIGPALLNKVLDLKRREML